MEVGSEISIGNEIHNSLEGNMKKIEMETGLKFDGPVEFEYSKGRPLSLDDPDLINPGVGFFDYPDRKVFINPEQFERQKNGFHREIDEDYVKDHELRHILERDALGRDPEYPHLIHAVLDEAERKRLAGMVFFAKDKDYQEIVFGKEVDFNFNTEDSLTFMDSVVRFESLLLKSVNMDNLGEVSVEKLGVAGLMTTDLRLLKTVVFADRINSPKVAMKFDTMVVGINPVMSYFSMDVRNISDELSLIDTLNRLDS